MCIYCPYQPKMEARFLNYEIKCKFDFLPHKYPFFLSILTSYLIIVRKKSQNVSHTFTFWLNTHSTIHNTSGMAN